MNNGLPELFDNNEQAERVRESAKGDKQDTAQFQYMGSRVRRRLVLTIVKPLLPACYTDGERVLDLTQKRAINSFFKSGKVGEDA